MPQLLAVQAASCAPVFQAFLDGNETVEPIRPSPTAASGIAIGHPARGAEILSAIRATDGSVVIVSEEQISEARNQLARQGFLVEATSAAAVAALADIGQDLPTDEPVVVPLTGHGLKSDPASSQ
jgi:threonine synthase